MPHDLHDLIQRLNEEGVQRPPYRPVRVTGTGTLAVRAVFLIAVGLLLLWMLTSCGPLMPRPPMELPFCGSIKPPPPDCPT